MSTSFQALVVRQAEEKQYSRKIETRSTDDLPEGEVLVRVHYSSLNYKDGLSCIGAKGVTREYPHTPGIDAAGIVESSSSDEFKSGDSVIVTSYDLGMNTSGGFGQFIRVPSAWVVPLPEGMTLRESMVYGTAGYTAGLSVNALLHQGLTPEQGPIVVTGASGGVGSVSVALLAGLGFQVKASSGKTEAADFLRELGATEIIGREEVNDESGKPMLKQLWAGGIDTVGGNALSTMIKACQAGGAVAVTGNVVSPDLPITVFPFILRGVNVLGIDSQNTPMALRRKVWNLLAGEWKPKNLENLAKECTLDQLDPEIERILSGAQQGRVLVNLQ